MNAIKETTIKSIQNLPDSCTVEDIMYEVNFVAQIYEGLEDSKQGKIISTDELFEKINTWKK